MAIGIGPSVKKSSLQAISGPNVADPANGIPVTKESDVILSEFDDLGTVLIDLFKEYCGGKVIVKKYVNGESTPVAGWKISASAFGGEVSPS